NTRNTVCNGGGACRTAFVIRDVPWRNNLGGPSDGFSGPSLCKPRKPAGTGDLHHCAKAKGRDPRVYRAYAARPLSIRRNVLEGKRSFRHDISVDDHPCFSPEGA